MSWLLLSLFICGVKAEPQTSMLLTGFAKINKTKAVPQSLHMMLKNHFFIEDSTGGAQTFSCLGKQAGVRKSLNSAICKNHPSYSCGYHGDINRSVPRRKKLICGDILVDYIYQ